jgi:hypothetical protein
MRSKALKIVALPFVLAAGLSAVQTSPPTVAGMYTCAGTDAHGRAYRSTLEIAAHVEGYAMQWGPARPPVVFGFGIVHRAVLAAWIVDTGNAVVGVVVYTIAPDTLEGTWTAGDGRTHPESCQRDWLQAV